MAGHVRDAGGFSCRGPLGAGLLCAALTDVPGASHAFLGGAVAYDEPQKTRWAAVRAEVLAHA